MPRFSIITPTWNSVRTLSRTIECVRAQSLRDYEHVIIDNCSTDGTQALAAGYGDPRIRVISEPDCGVYDAMNKGIAATSGELVAILNADDVFADMHVLRDVSDLFARSEADVVYGDLVFVNAGDKVTRSWRSGPYRPGRWRAGWHPPHPSTLVKRAAYQRLGTYDASYKLSADYKLMLQFGHKHGARFAYLPRVLVRMRIGGLSTRGLAPIVRSNMEALRAWKDLGLRAPRLLTVRKLLYKLGGKLVR